MSFLIRRVLLVALGAATLWPVGTSAATRAEADALAIVPDSKEM